MSYTRKFFVATVAAIVVMVGATVAQAQERAVVDVGFNFTAAGKAMPAGKYTVEASESKITLTGPKGAVMLPVLTRLGRHDNDQEPELVFDKLNGQLLLSEVWPSGGADGYLLLSTKERHEHHVLGGSHPTK